MRELSANDLKSISGGIYCVDGVSYDYMVDTIGFVLQDAEMVRLISLGAVGFIGAATGVSIPYTIIAALSISQFAYDYELKNSELWPWSWT